MNAEIFKYIVAGGLAFLVDFSVLYVCTEFLGTHYLVSNLFGYACGMLVAYALNTRWVFSYRRYEKKSGREFLIFNLIAVLGLGISEALMALLVSGWGMYYLLAKVVASFFVMVFNYVAKKFILFHPSAEAEQT